MSATIGSVRVAASNTRRLTRPHCPPDRCCTISSASDPSVSPRQKRKPINHERRNWSTSMKPPIAPAATPMTAMVRRSLLEPAQRGRVDDLLLVSPSDLSACTGAAGAFGTLRRIAAGHVRARRRVLAELQRADVGHDVPPVARRDLRPVVRHAAEAVRHHVEEVARLDLPQAIDVERRRLRVAALHDQPLAAAGARRGTACRRC